MENDKMSDVFNKFQDILKEKNIDFNSIMNNSSTSDSSSTSDTSDSSINFDINTILKLKKILDKLNSQNNPRNTLLYSIKPFLREEKKEKLDLYIKISNILSILELLNKENL